MGNGKALAEVKPIVLNLERIEITPNMVRKYIAPNATQEELFTFMAICRSFGLNPFKREIHFIKFGDTKAQIVVGYEVYLRRGEMTGKLDGWKWELKKDQASPQEEYAEVTIYRKDWTHPFIHRAYRSDFKWREQKQGSKPGFWDHMNKFALIKTCIGQAFRLCFPVEMGGMPYMPEEIKAGMSDDLPSDIIEPEIIQSEQLEQNRDPHPEEEKPQEAAPKGKSNADALAEKEKELDKARKHYFTTASEMFANEDERHKWQVEMFPALPSTKEWNLQHYKEAMSRLEIQKKKPETNLIASTENLIRDFCTQENLEYNTVLDFLSATTISIKESILNSVDIHDTFVDMQGDKQKRKNVVKAVEEYNQWVKDCNEVEPFQPSGIIEALYQANKQNSAVVGEFYNAMSDDKSSPHKEVKRLWHIEIDKLSDWQKTLDKVLKKLGINADDIWNAVPSAVTDDVPF